MIEGRDLMRAFEFMGELNGEVGWRTQAGRAYYAAFLEARSVCEIHFSYERNRSSREHADIARILTRFDPRLGDDLALLRRLRNLADYDLTLSAETTQLQAARSGEYARSIISRLDRIVMAANQADADDELTDV